jgi:hypothetical protein
MSKAWPKVRLGEVLTRSTEATELKPDVEYREITVRLWGKGVVERGCVLGAEIASGRWFKARSGQFIASRIDARNGAMGIVPDALDGSVVTNDFPLFNLNADRIHEHLSNLYFRGEIAKGSTIRNFRTVQKEGGREVARNVEGKKLERYIGQYYFGSGGPYSEGALEKTK